MGSEYQNGLFETKAICSMIQDCDDFRISSRLSFYIEQIKTLIGCQVFYTQSAWTTMAEMMIRGRFDGNWDKEIFLETYALVDKLMGSAGTNKSSLVLEGLLSSTMSFWQHVPEIELLYCGGMNNLTKIRLLALPLYIALVEGSFANLARSLLPLLEDAKGKDYTGNNNLSNLRDILISNGFDLLGSVPNVNLRNAINHGRVRVIGDNRNVELRYSYRSGSETYHERLGSGQMVAEVLRAAKGIMSASLAVCAAFFSNKHVTSVWIEQLADDYARAMYLGFGVGSSDAICIDCIEVKDKKQLSYTFEVPCLSTTRLYQLAEYLFLKIYEQDSSYLNYCISFSNVRMLPNFFRLSASDIRSFLANSESEGELISIATEKRGFLPPVINREEISTAEAMFHVFPQYEREGLYICDIEDCSLEDRKRLKANAFIGEAGNRNEILLKIKDAVDWVSNLYNPPMLATKVVHGSMKADCVYLNVYLGADCTNRSLLFENENFVCQVEYCPNVAFRLKDNNRLIAYLYRNAEWFTAELRVLWRDRSKLTQTNQNVVGRNDPCPCGSGKKYKKCCGA